MLTLNLMFKSQTWGHHIELVSIGISLDCLDVVKQEVNESFGHRTSIILALILVNGQVSKHCVKERYDGRGCAVVAL